MTSSCLSQFQGWKISILVGVWRSHSGISRSFNGVIIYRCKLQHLVNISILACSSFHLKFSHHISALWSEAHLMRYSSIWGSFSCSSILYYDLNYMYINLINHLGLNSNISHVFLSNIEERAPFPQYLVVNFCNLDGFEYMCEPLMIYEWMNFN